jgi:hypothetical protein
MGGREFGDPLCHRAALGGRRPPRVRIDMEKHLLGAGEDVARSGMVEGGEEVQPRTVAAEEWDGRVDGFQRANLSLVHDVGLDGVETPAALAVGLVHPEPEEQRVGGVAEHLQVTASVMWPL